MPLNAPHTENFTVNSKPAVGSPFALGKQAQRNQALQSGTGAAMSTMPPVDASRANKATLEDTTINGLNGAYSAGTGLFMVDMVTGLVAAGVGGALRMMGMHSAKASLDQWLRAPMHAMRNTTLDNIGSFTANVAAKGEEFTGKAAGMAGSRGNNEAAKKILDTRTDKLAVKAARANARVAEDIFSGIEKSEKRGFIGKMVDRFASWRLSSHEAELAKYLDTVSMLEIEPISRGFASNFKSKAGVLAPSAIKYDAMVGAQIGVNIDTLKSTRDLGQFDQAIAGARAEMMSAYKSAAAASGETARLHMGRAQAFEAAMQNFAEAKISAQKTMQYSGIKGAKLGGLFKALPKLGGKLSIWSAVIGAGLAAGTAATWMMSKRDNRVAAESLKELAGDVYGVPSEQVTKEMLEGPNAHPLMQQASKMHHSQARGRYASSAVYTAGNMVTGGTLRASGIGNIANYSPYAMVADMTLPQLGDMLVPENSTLNAYAVLKQSDKGAVALQPNDKVTLVRQLMAAVPAVAKHAGVDNKMTTAVATEIVNTHKSTAEIVKTLADPQKFVAISQSIIAREVEAKKKAEEAQAKAAAETANDNVHSANDNTLPKPQISVASSQHDGRIQESQKQVSA